MKLGHMREVLILGLLGWTLSGCASSSFEDATRTIIPLPLSTPLGSYANVAWLDESRFAFDYAPRPSIDPLDFQITTFDLDTKEWSVLPVPKPSECFSAWSQNLARLPNGSLGFIHRCNLESPGEYFTLYTWDKETNGLQVLQRYPQPFAAADYTFSPDMSELIQEEAVGPKLENELYRVKASGQMEQIFSDWQRVQAPSWSPDGRVIAFLGTEKYPGGDSSAFTSLGQIADLATYPWDIYLMDANGSNVRLALTGITDTGILKWSPQGHVLAFVGTYKNAKGIWLLNVDTAKVTRIWASRAGFDWSPDGQQMVVLPWTFDSQGNREAIQPVIIDVPVNVID